MPWSATRFLHHPGRVPTPSVQAWHSSGGRAGCGSRAAPAQELGRADERRSCSPNFSKPPVLLCCGIANAAPASAWEPGPAAAPPSPARRAATSPRTVPPARPLALAWADRAGLSIGEPQPEPRPLSARVPGQQAMRMRSLARAAGWSRGRGHPPLSGRGAGRAPKGSGALAFPAASALCGARRGLMAATSTAALVGGIRESGSGVAAQGRKKTYGKGRTAKALKSLQFANPGRQTEFAPESSKREKRRLQTKSTSVNSDRILITPGVGG
ncbi:ARL14 effector protein isoform X2 [Dermochelys coriacea]|uniref:ARL14 effector protein isoform X2 n=1 Tax=Dermochelys coriacea TaxID=27794 RepID=UPI001CA810DA|nr:ARL14 effector protein isoform X2 [Dermochelys coriacea]